MHFLAIGQPFIPGWTQLRPFVAELWLIATIVAVLLAPFFTRRSNLICAMIALAGLACALISVLAIGAGPEVSGDHFRGLLLCDPVAVFWKVLLLLFVMGIVIMWAGTTALTMPEGDGPEFFTLLLGATLGMSLMVCTSNLLMLVLAVEMASLPSYVMAGFRKTHRVGAEAALKYVLFGAVTSSIMVYGLSLLYGLYGTLQINTIMVDGQAVPGLAARLAAGSGASSALLLVALIGLVVGLGFKISAVPFHFWCPDVFEGASIDVSAFLSVASKGAGLTLLLRVLMLIADACGYHNTPHLSLSAMAIFIGILGAVTATVGNTAAFVQTNIKRLLAYSSIAHAGYMLCALSVLVAHNSVLTSTGGLNAPVQVLLLYLAVYLFMNLGAFTAAAVVQRHTGSEQLADYAALGRRAPFLAAAMACCLLSLVGLPPFGGFIAKFNLLALLVQNGGWGWWLVVAIGINTILSLYYYMRVIKVMYLTPGDQGSFAASPIGSSLAMGCAGVLFLMLVFYSPLSNLTWNYAQMNTVTGVAPVTVVHSAPSSPAVFVAR